MPTDRARDADLRKADGPRITPADMALFTDQYQLTMAQAYVETGMVDEATFSLFIRKLPDRRNFLLAAGLEDVLHYLENMRFDTASLDYIASIGEFSDRFLRWLETMIFEGTVRAMPEGTPFFANEPILEVTAPVAQGQIAETFIMNQISVQTVLASKAIRHTLAAEGRAVVDFGARRMHGIDAGIKAARAFHIAGVSATSNLLAGRIYGVPVSGTMAHSYIQVFEDEMDAFRAFARLYPETILLVDTYDTLDGVRKVAALAGEMGSDFKVRGIRLDSGDLVDLACRSREILDEAGLTDVEIFASGGLDEDGIADFVARGAPITGFGVGTEMAVSRDDPAFDIAYKLTEYGGEGRMKLSSKKMTLPGRKQVFRMERDGKAARDVIARAGETLAGRPLLEEVMREGARSGAAQSLHDIRAYARDQVARLPREIRQLEPAAEPYAAEVSEELAAYRDRIADKLSSGHR